MDSQATFDSTWLVIQSLSPSAFLIYLKTYWVTEEFLPMWSGVVRRGRSIYEQSDTTMLVEA